MRKLMILLAATAMMCIVALQPAQAQKKSKKNQTPAATPALSPDAKYFYVTISGNKQGAFKGQSTSAEHPGQITGFQFLCQTTGTEAASGQATGRRQYSPVVFTKELDASSPQLFEAASTNEVLSLVQFDFIRTSPDGKEYVYETIKLTDATISSLKDYMGFPDAGEASDPRQLEDVSLTFRKIEFSNNDGKTTSIDDWTSAP
jgi:type VI secretion system secreted protein Hcp